MVSTDELDNADMSKKLHLDLVFQLIFNFVGTMLFTNKFMNGSI